VDDKWGIGVRTREYTRSPKETPRGDEGSKNRLKKKKAQVKERGETSSLHTNKAKTTKKEGILKRGLLLEHG